jgi:hypothetical protein
MQKLRFSVSCTYLASISISTFSPPLSISADYPYPPATATAAIPLPHFLICKSNTCIAQYTESPYRFPFLSSLISGSSRYLSSARSGHGGQNFVFSTIFSVDPTSHVVEIDQPAHFNPLISFLQTYQLLSTSNRHKSGQNFPPSPPPFLFCSIIRPLPFFRWSELA